MARHDVYRNAAGGGFLLDVQADLFEILNTRVVVPLLAVDQAPPRAARLNPVFAVGGAEVVMVTQFMAAVSVGVLGERIASLAHEHDMIVAALDMLFQGY